MAPTVVKPITTETFRSYAERGTSNRKIQDRICALLFRICVTDDPAVVERNCRAEIDWLEGQDFKASTRTSYVSAYRKALHAYFDERKCPETVMSEQETVKGLITQHCSLDFMFASPEDYEAINNKTKRKTAQQRDHLTGFDAAAAVATTEQALQSEDWRELAAGLIMATQSRPSDMLSSSEFKAVSKYRLEFTSRVKKRGAIAQGEIFCLVESVTFIDAFSRLRRASEVMAMKDWSLRQIDSGKNAALNRAVNRIYGEIIPPPYGEEKLSCKNLRAAGVNAAYWLHGREDQSLGRFAELQLLHDNPGAAANYEDFYATDAEGKRLLDIGVRADAPLARKPKSQKRSTVSVDAQLRDMIGDAAQWGEGSHAERLERIIARALQADKLAAQLARECEKRQALELKLKRLEQSMSVEPVDVVAPPSAAVDADAATGFDWRAVPNAELKGDRRNDAYHEKLRRSVEALQEYNAGRELSEQYGINSSVLRQMTGVNPGLVKKWMEEHDAELTAYKKAQGHIYQQNKGKPNPKRVMKWSEQAYGEYAW